MICWLFKVENECSAASAIADEDLQTSKTDKALQYHDDGEGFTIHTEKNDIWERMSEPELERLEGILSRKALYYRCMCNLIDLLREMALSVTQIIITTANDQISKFIRHKFSFLEEEYSHLELVRKGSEQTQIEVIHYSYNKKTETSRRRLVAENG